MTRESALHDALLPLNAIWLDADGVGKMLGYEARIIRERIACRPDFPKPVRLGGGRGHPRWNAAEVDAWMRAQRELTGGRPRQSSSAATSETSGA
jgi:predicted DNA-binding transcriptional regulator AlpA